MTRGPGYLSSLSAFSQDELTLTGYIRAVGRTGAGRCGWLLSRQASFSVAIYFVTFGAKLLVTEELAWRGFALPRLLVGRSALSASVILGLLWGVWHTPLFFIAGTGQSTWPYLGFLLFAIAESVLMTWMYNNTRDSVLLSTLFHAASDAALVFSGVLVGGQLLFWLTVAVTCAAALVVVIVEGPTRLARGKRADQAALAPPEYAAEESVTT
ncbi:MAG: CPBP family intramembrane glutamic endopeptidase [Ktedonobacteraceae bacterium]